MVFNAAKVLVTAAALAMLMPASADEAYEPARRADGKPDLSGIWQVMNTANYDIEAHPARPAMQVRQGPLGPVPARELGPLGAVAAVPAGPGVVEGGELPYTPEALKQRDENRANWLERDPEIRCYLPGVPRANYMPFPFQIFHSDQFIFMAYEYAGATRNIAMEDPGPPATDAWMGQSVGHWDGDTLVVNVRGFLGRTWFDRAGNFHSHGMTVTERYTPTSPHTMRYEATIEDPNVFTRPWTMSMNLYRRVGEDAQLQQFNCIPFVEELLYGHLRKHPIEE